MLQGLKVYCRACEVVRVLKALAIKLHCLSLIPGTHKAEEKVDSRQLCSDLHTHIMACTFMRMHTYTHTHNKDTNIYYDSINNKQ